LAKSKRKILPEEPVAAEIESLNHKGQGRARVDGKPIRIHGALPGERVRFRYTRIARDRAEGTVVDVLAPAPERVAPRCPHAALCGGCSLQHMAPAAQIRWKQGSLERELEGRGVRPDRWLPPLAAAPFGYRRKARLGVRYVEKKGRTLVGFRERGTSFVADLARCEILHPAVGERIGEIAALIDELSIRDRIPQIEIAMGDGPCVLVLRVLAPPTAADRERLLAFGAATGLRLYLQEGGAESVRPLPGQGVDLSYALAGATAGGRTDAPVRLHFEPTDFTQVNLDLNRLMVAQALDLLAPEPDQRVLDLFCGLGNFTLPMARRAARALGVEGDAGLVERARANARHNRVENAWFEVTDLYRGLEGAPWLAERFDLAVLDPPRSGALPILEKLPALGVARILYVSCNPGSLATDADRLVNALGYRLRAAGALDMFPHTTHLEAMALFDRG